MKKSLFVAASLVLLLSSCGKSVTSRLETGSGSLPSATPLTHTTDIMALPQEERAAAIEAKIKDVPQEWGAVLSWEREKDDQGKPLGLYRITYANRIWGILQPGINKLYFARQTDQGDCFVIKEKYQEFSGPGDMYGECGVVEHGFYDFSSKTIVPIIGARSRFSLDPQYDDTPLRHAPFKIAGRGDLGVFSPGGTYFGVSVDVYEGCGCQFVSTENGSVIQAGDDRSINHYDYEEVFGCGATVAFSQDEKVVAILAQYRGMASPGTEFTVITRESTFSVLPLLLRDPKKDTNDAEGDPDVLNTIGITSLDSSSIRFTVDAKSTDLTPGSFEYTFAARKLTKLK